MRVITHVGLILVLLLSVPYPLAQGEAELRKQRLIWVGEVSRHVDMYFDLIPTDPRFELTTVVPCNLIHPILPYEEATRFVRIYLPRKYSDLQASVDGMIFDDFSPKVLTPEHLEWFRKGVEDGIGLCLVEFAQRVSECGMEYWEDTILYDAFPADLFPNCIEAIDGKQFYKVVKEGPIMDFPGIEKMILNWGHTGDLIPREGATTWAIWRGRKTPALVSREYGNGTVLHYDHGWGTFPEEVKRNWRYLPDYIFNHLCFVTGLPFPDDLELTHEARALFAALDEQTRVAISVIEFIDKFGANSRPFETQLSQIHDQKLQAEGAYLQGDLTGAAEILADLNEEATRISSDMMEAKNRAMLWIFVIEWLAVTATGMICGFILWTVMVRKKLYREVEATRLSQRLE